MGVTQYLISSRSKYIPPEKNKTVHYLKSDTLIETANGFNYINELKRNDMIKTNSGIKPLCRLRQSMSHRKILNWVLFPKGSLNKNTPSNDIYCTETYPIFINYKYVQAKDFIDKVEGVKLVPNTENNPGFNIIFEDPTIITLHNLEMGTLNPQHPLLGLREKDFFDKNKYRPGFFNEEYTSYDEAMNV